MPSTQLVKPQWDRILSNYNFREPLPPLQIRLSLPVPHKLPYSHSIPTAIQCQWHPDVLLYLKNFFKKKSDQKCTEKICLTVVCCLLYIMSLHSYEHLQTIDCIVLNIQLYIHIRQLQSNAAGHWADLTLDLLIISCSWCSPQEVTLFELHWRSFNKM